mgnify:CR=1 FL=1
MADTVKTNLGPVTAYADAKAHGYTGTREEFGQLLAGAAGNLQDAVAAKEGAEAAKQSAETAQKAAAENQKNAGTHAENAKASADTAAEQANFAKESAAGAANSATAAQESETNAGLSATAAANAEAAAKQAQQAAETAKTDAEAAQTAAGTSADAAANSAADAKKTLESIPDDYSTLSRKVDENTSGIRELKEDKLNKPALPVVGELLRVKSVSDTGEVELETEDISELQKRQNILVGSETSNPVSCDDAFAAPLCGLTVYGKSTQDGTPTPDSPVPIVSAGDGGTIAVKMTGKNLLYIPDGKGTARGVTITSKNGIISISGTATEDGYVYLPVKQISIHGLALLSSNVSATTVKLVSASWNVLFTQDSANNTQEVITRICFIVKKGTNYDLNGINVQLELGSTATAYSPYREQLLTLPTPTGLPGIPITSGGNYTDPSGQQWICDEVDLERGVRVKNTCIVDAADLEITTSTDLQSTKRLSFLLPALARSSGTNALCNRSVRVVSFDKDITHFYVNNRNIFLFIPISTENPVAGEYIFLYALAAPVETPLTAEELAAYKSLTTYAPNTVVQASDGAGVKLDYQRDVNLVIKNLEDAIASMTTT